MAEASPQRLDAFTDAAFAFAVTLLVVGAASGGTDAATLRQLVAAIPSFAIGFAIIAMFWNAHVAWRALRGPGDARSVLLTLLLVFTVLIYVLPLRAMAVSFAGYIAGDGSGYRGGIAELFVIYGLGFIAMTLITALLFRDALRNAALDADGRRQALGQMWIWAILAWTGVVSVTLALIPETRIWAPWVYATLPVTITLFSWRWRWAA